MTRPTRAARIRERAYELLREDPDVRHFSEAWARASREIPRPTPREVLAEERERRRPVDGRVLEEAAGRLFGDGPRGPRLSDEEVIRAADRLFV